MAERAFTTEAELCAAFIAALPTDWTSYAETQGWDILLVHDDGTQIGIEAKLKLNSIVLAQCLDDLHSYWTTEGPDYRAALVPMGAAVAGCATIARHLGITVLEMPARTPRYNYGRPYHPSLPDGKAAQCQHDWFERCPTRRHKLPDLVPDVAAGTAAPVQLTEWKIKALRIMALLERRGSVCRADFRALQIDPSRWTQFWLKPGPEGYTRDDETPDFASQHPKAYAEIVATFDEWAPPQSLQQAALVLPSPPARGGG